MIDHLANEPIPCGQNFKERIRIAQLFVFCLFPPASCIKSRDGSPPPNATFSTADHRLAWQRRRPTRMFVYQVEFRAVASLIESLLLTLFVAPLQVVCAQSSSRFTLAWRI